jgi:7-carboxy-7-deazaguanine synthase
VSDPIYINEIYASIQGESTHAGRPCTFVRLSGCPLRCKWCDTVYSFGKGDEMSFTQIIDQVKEHGINLVEFTGGEPLAQLPCYQLINQMVDEGFEILIETSGSETIKGLNERVQVIMDLKCPDSGMEPRNLYENIELLQKNHEVKFVVASRKDFDWAVDKVKQYDLSSKCTVLFSCAFGLVKEEQLVDWLVQSKVDARLNVQIHKYIWSPRKKGV